MSEANYSKKALSSPLAGAAAAGLAGAYIRLIGATTRRQIFGREYADPLFDADKGFILAFWHSRMLLGPIIRRETERPVHMLISTHRDGEMIARAVERFGISLIRGSAADPKKPGKDKSGAPAIGQMLAALEAGGVVGMTPDGPRGPRQRAKIGVIKLAAMSGAPILPASCSASSGPRLNSWDRFLLAAPFSRIAFVARPPIMVERTGDPAVLERARAFLEAELDAATAEADHAVGRKAE